VFRGGCGHDRNPLKAPGSPMRGRATTAERELKL
jgi:hypothetical protein